MSTTQQHCFDVCDGCAAYTDGAWVPRMRAPPYRLNASIYKPAGLKLSAVTPQHFPYDREELWRAILEVELAQAGEQLVLGHA